MKLIACLGNPGRQYARSRHNIGYIIGEALAERFSVRLSQKKFQALMGTGSTGGSDFTLLFPTTFMNNSGVAVRGAMDYFKLDVGELIVIHDEIELPFGDVRVKEGGGHKGHNGLRSIIEHIGSPDFTRVRFGVGRPPDERIGVAEYVLAPFLEEEIEKIRDMMDGVHDRIVKLVAD